MPNFGPGGAPEDGHPKQCQAKLKRKGGKLCKRWALKGSYYCQFHGGRIHKKKVPYIRLYDLPHFYSKHLRKTLQESVADALGAAPADQVSVFEELAVMRETLIPTLKMWDAAQGLENAVDAQVAAGMMLREQLKDVAAIADVANRIMLAGKGQFSIHSLIHIVDQIVRIAYDVFGEDEMDKAEYFERLVRERIKMPSEGTSGTLATPDMDVVEMDDTVPKEE